MIDSVRDYGLLSFTIAGVLIWSALPPLVSFVSGTTGHPLYQRIILIILLLAVLGYAVYQIVEGVSTLASDLVDRRLDR